MEIIDERVSYVHFESLYVGEMFEFDDGFFLKIFPVLDNDNNTLCNVVCVADGEHYFFNDTENVLPIKVSMRIVG